jgi:hypothetical protein
MRHFLQILGVLLISVVICVLTSPPAQAATGKLPGTATSLTLQIKIDQPEVFWNFNFLTRDSDIAKPAIIRIEWSVGDLSGQTKQETLVLDSSKSSGKLSISAEKGALVNLNVTVLGAKNLNLGSISLQVRNSGQTETVTITPPEIVEPKITWGG